MSYQCLIVTHCSDIKNAMISPQGRPADSDVLCARCTQAVLLVLLLKVCFKATASLIDSEFWPRDFLE